ncbi:hypothetical protein BJ508DRAFT_363569 [Ascobolus immersus RN42]|uniref:N-acetyltransferase domain-containing protein n=1 Tax=Ascobolus immersus RN42 TaxID=1160509 RepID=A0A3N4HZ40_ASCIM|nr:hypothetical protein BJ508DRAFT_363569 [Ascobolus immersus RN42]
MSDDLLLQHSLLSNPSHIPPSSPPPWFTPPPPPSKDASTPALLTTNKTFILIPSTGPPPSLNWHAFFQISPRWSLTTFHKPTALRFASRTLSPSSFTTSTTSTSLKPTIAAADASLDLGKFTPCFEMLLDSSSAAQHPVIPHPSDEHPFTITEDSAFLTSTFPELASLHPNEKFLACIDPANGRRAGYLTLLPSSTGARILVTGLVIMPEYQSSHRALGFDRHGRSVARRLLEVVKEVFLGEGVERGREVWLGVGTEEFEVWESAVECGWRVNREFWRLEGGGETAFGGEKKGKVVGGGEAKVELGNWEDGMRGWEEDWSRALEKVSLNG